MMKKLLIISLMMVLVFGLIGCETATNPEEVHELAAGSGGSSTEINILLQGNSYKTRSVSDASYDDFDIQVDLNGDGTIGNFAVGFTDDEDNDVSKSDYFYLNNYGVLQYRNADKLTSSSPKMKFKDLKTGNILEYALPTSVSNAVSVFLNLQGNSHEIMSNSDATQDDFSFKVDMDGDSTIGNYAASSFGSNENSAFSKNTLFFLKDYGVLKYVGADASASKITFYDWNTQNNIEYAFSTCTAPNYVEVMMNVQGNSYKIQSASDYNVDDFSIKMDLDGDGTIGNYAPSVSTAYLESSVSKNDYIYLKDYGVIQYVMADKISNTAPKIKFKELVSNTSIELAIPPTITNNFIANINLGGRSYRVENASSMTVDDFQIVIDADHNGNAGDYGVGDMVILSEAVAINKNDYVLIPGYGLFVYRGADGLTKTSPKLQMRDEQTSNNIEMALSAPSCSGSNIGVNINLGGNSYQVDGVGDTNSNDFQINVDMDHSGTTGDYAITVQTNELSAVNKNDYFLIKDYGIVKYKMADGITSTAPKMKLYDERTKNDIELALPASSGSSILTTINIGGQSYDVVSRSDTSVDDFDIGIDFDDSGTIGDWMITVAADESDTILKNDYFFIKDYGLLRYRLADAVTKTSPKIQFYDLVSGNTLEYALPTASSSSSSSTTSLPTQPSPTPQPATAPPAPTPVSTQTPTPAPTPTPTCQGCDYNGNCWTTGTTLNGLYCDTDGVMKTQKSAGLPCTANYECQNNNCDNGSCYTANPFSRIFRWFSSWFS